MFLLILWFMSEIVFKLKPENAPAFAFFLPFCRFWCDRFSGRYFLMWCWHKVDCCRKSCSVLLSILMLHQLEFSAVIRSEHFSSYIRITNLLKMEHFLSLTWTWKNRGKVINDAFESVKLLPWNYRRFYGKKKYNSVIHAFDRKT